MNQNPEEPKPVFTQLAEHLFGPDVIHTYRPSPEERVQKIATIFGLICLMAVMGVGSAMAILAMLHAVL